MGFSTYAGDVKCPTCQAEPFSPCVYVWTQLNKRRGVVGKPMFRNGHPYWHNERQYAQSEFEHTYIYGIAVRELKTWLAEYGDILSERT